MPGGQGFSIYMLDIGCSARRPTLCHKIHGFEWFRSIFSYGSVGTLGIQFAHTDNRIKVSAVHKKCGSSTPLTSCQRIAAISIITVAGNLTCTAWKDSINGQCLMTHFGVTEEKLVTMQLLVNAISQVWRSLFACRGSQATTPHQFRACR